MTSNITLTKQSLTQTTGVSQSSRSLLGDAASRFQRNWLAVAGLTMLLLFALAGILANLLPLQSPFSMGLGNAFSSPSRQHLLGTDDLGRDLLSRLIYGVRYSLGLSFLIVVLSASIGLLLGAVAAFAGGFVDSLMMRLVDILFAFPAFLLALALVAFLGPRLENIIVVLTIAHLPRYIRLMRGSVLGILNREYVEAARVIGSSNLAQLKRHIAPNAIAPIVIYGSLDLGIVITSLAGLSFLGVGIQPPTPGWGLMLTDARNNLAVAPWTAIVPGLAISLAVISCNVIGDGLRDAFDPRQYS